MVYAKVYAVALVVFLGLDLLWLGLIARRFYADQLGGLLRENIGFAAAGGFYLVYVAGVIYFAVAPALQQESWSRAAANGALLGLLAYGTYDMTNLATLKGWPPAMSLVDMAWGSALTGVTALSGYLVARSL